MSYPKLRDNVWKRDYPVQRRRYRPGCSQITSHCVLRTVRMGEKIQEEGQDRAEFQGQIL